MERGRDFVTDVWEASVAVPMSSALGEGPWWDSGSDRLMWVDMPDGLVHVHSPATGSLDTTKLADTVGFIVGRSDGGYVVGTAAGLVTLDGDVRPTGNIGAPPDLDEHRRINDGVCDPAGRVLFGTVDPSGSETGTLWSLSQDGTFAALVDGVRMSNGLAFSPDGRKLYYVDSLTQLVAGFRYDPLTGQLFDRQSFFRVPEHVGLPDGLAVDESGCVWLAIWGAGEVWRLSPGGEHVGTVRVPASRTTSCAFGGAERDTLYITTAREGGPDREVDRVGAPGALFVAEVGASGASVWTAASQLRHRSLQRG